MKAVGYIRVSTEEQSRDGISLDLQAQKIRAYCDLHDLELVDTVKDAGISGKSIEKRPGIREVLKRVSAGEVDAIIVYKLDRLAGNTIETLMMVEEMEKTGVALHSITENLDTKSAIGRFVVRIMAALAEMERDQIAERTKAALAIKKASGGRVGLHAHYGYSIDGDTLVKNDREQQALRVARDLRRQGRSFRAISEEMARQGFLSRNGTPFNPAAVRRMTAILSSSEKPQRGRLAKRASKC